MKAVTVFLMAAAVGLSASVVTGANGVTITMKTTSDGKTQTNTVQLDANHIRAETGDADTPQIMIFDGTNQVLDIVNPKDKTYTEMTKADVERISQQMAGAMSQMQAAMANMPPEQRARMEAMMKGRMGGAGAAGADAAAKPVYKKVGTDTVGKWTCQKYERYDEGKKTSEICTVDPSEIGLSTSDFAVTKQMADFFSGMLKFAPQLQAQSRQMFTLGTLESQGYSGIPIKSTHEVMGKTYTSELESVSRGDVPDSAFQVPAGYQKKAMPMMGGRR